MALERIFYDVSMYRVPPGATKFLMGVIFIFISARCELAILDFGFFQMKLKKSEIQRLAFCERRKDEDTGRDAKEGDKMAWKQA